jgi:hypothetical protein
MAKRKEEVVEIVIDGDNGDNVPMQVELEEMEVIRTEDFVILFKEKQEKAKRDEGGRDNQEGFKESLRVDEKVEEIKGQEEIESQSDSYDEDRQ